MFLSREILHSFKLISQDRNIRQNYYGSRSTHKILRFQPMLPFHFSFTVSLKDNIFRKKIQKKINIFLLKLDIPSLFLGPFSSSNPSIKITILENQGYFLKELQTTFQVPLHFNSDMPCSQRYSSNFVEAKITKIFMFFEQKIDNFQLWFLKKK